MLATMVISLCGSPLLIFIVAVLSTVHECQSYNHDEYCPEWSRYRCSDGKCIPKKFFCDKWVDCDNGEDEVTCIKEATPYRCPPWHFPCADKSQCVSITFRCYGSNVCFDGSNDANCPPENPCRDYNIGCETGDQCIHSNFWCDGKEDCRDGSDESNCMATTCDDESFNCGNGTCIPEDWRCDGTRDCSNGSDETCQSPRTKCWPGDRSCKRSGECIPEEMFCDGEANGCRDGSDEEDCPVNNVTATTT